MAADSPLTAPWAYQLRGSMLGSSDHHHKSSAAARPANDGRRHSRPRFGRSRTSVMLALVQAYRRGLEVSPAARSGGSPLRSGVVAGRHPQEVGRALGLGVLTAVATASAGALVDGLALGLRAGVGFLACAGQPAEVGGPP
jgi:hypothetical protein